MGEHLKFTMGAILHRYATVLNFGRNSLFRYIYQGLGYLVTCLLLHDLIMKVELHFVASLYKIHSNL